MDIASIKPVDRKVKILHPATKEELGIVVTIMSPRDKRLDGLRNQQAQKQLNLQTKNKAQKVDDLKNDRRKILFSAITNWEWGTDPDGEPNSFNGERPNSITPLVLKEIDDSDAAFIIEQIDDAFGEWESFLQIAETD
jgi:hypothetical protein